MRRRTKTPAVPITADDLKAAAERVVAAMPDELAQLREAVGIHEADTARLVRLVRYMARSYGPGGPVWPEVDTYGAPLGANVELAETWRLLFGAPRCEFAGCDAEAVDLAKRRCEAHR